MTGRYPSLCKHSLLSSEEAGRVRVAEKQENLSTCLLGRYPTLCNHSLLSTTERQEVTAAEAAARQELPASSSTRRRTARAPVERGECDSEHWIDSVSDDGSIIKLEDGSIWEVDPVDTVDSMLWLPVTEVIICDDRMINTDDNETVRVTRLK
jgi:hypothetical protein